MQGAVHRNLVGHLVSEGASTLGFRTAVKKYLRATPGWTRDYEDDVTVPSVIPDAYLLEPAWLPGREDLSWLGRIVVWEVEVTHSLSETKLASYVDFAGTLDDTDLHACLELRTVDKYGTVRIHDLLTHRLRFRNIAA